MFEQRVLEQSEWRRKVERERDEEQEWGREPEEQKLEQELWRAKEGDAEAAEDRRLSQAAAIRRLFNRAVLLNKFHSASWIGWAKFEQKHGNPGSHPWNPNPYPLAAQFTSFPPSL